MKERMAQYDRLADWLDVLTPVQVATALSIGVNTAYELLRQGEIRGIRIGRRWRVLKSEVLEYLQPEGGRDEQR